MCLSKLISDCQCFHENTNSHNDRFFSSTVLQFRLWFVYYKVYSVSKLSKQVHGNTRMVCFYFINISIYKLNSCYMYGHVHVSSYPYIWVLMDFQIGHYLNVHYSWDDVATYLFFRRWNLVVILYDTTNTIYRKRQSVLTPIDWWYSS